MLECLKCKSHCCVGGFAFVGINDAKKIKKFTGLDYKEFLDYSKLSKKVLKMLKEDDPVLEGTLRYSLVKDGRLLRIKNDKKCFFFKNGKCSIYSVRPKICRIYPYWCVKLISGRIKVIEHDSENTCAICDVDNVDETEIKKLFNDILKEAKYYEKHIDEFLRYLI